MIGLHRTCAPCHYYNFKMVGLVHKLLERLVGSSMSFWATVKFKANLSNLVRPCLKIKSEKEGQGCR